MSAASFLSDIRVALSNLKAVSIAFLVVTFVSVLLRLWTRLWILKKFHSDDYVIVLAWLPFVVTCGLTIALHGMLTALFTGHKVDVVSIQLFAKIDITCYILSLVLIKVALSLFFLRIFLAHRLQTVIIYTILIVTVVTSLAYFFLSVISCGLNQGLLDPGAPSSCSVHNEYSNFSIAWSCIHAGTDIILSILSVNALWGAKLPRKTKIISCLILLLGTLGGVASIMRIVVLIRQPNFSNRYVGGLDAAYWTIIEVGVGITAASLASLRPLFRLILNHFRFSEGSIPAPRPPEQGYATDERTLDDQDNSSKSFGVLPSVLLMNHLDAEVEPWDWRNDRLRPSEEIMTPDATFLSSVITLTNTTNTRTQSLA